jgi:tetratricopeptide (TPR) repeat protein
MGELPRAVSLAERALVLHPRLGPALHLRGRAQLMRDRPGEAVEILQQALAAEWHGDRPGWGMAAADLAWALARLGRFADGERTVRAALAAGADGLELRFALGHCLERQKRATEALAEYEAVLARRPGHAATRAAIERLRAPARPGG